MSDFQAQYTVIEETDINTATPSQDTPPPPPAKRGRGRPPGAKNGTSYGKPSGHFAPKTGVINYKGENVPTAAPAEHAADEQVEAVSDDAAELIQEIASQAAALAVKSAMGEAVALKSKVLAEVEAKAKEISERYAKPQALCLHVKLGELPPVKLSTRPAAILPMLTVQAKIAQSGNGNWPMLVGPTGCGKTVAASQLAEALKTPYSFINFSEGASETWVWGRHTPTGFVSGQFWERYTKGGVFLADEMDAANDNVLISLNTAIANGYASNPFNGEQAKMHPDFIFVAATNTNGKGGTGAYTGRTRLDGATLNRFAMFSVGYDRGLEETLCPNKALREALWFIRDELEKKGSADVISSRDMKNATGQLAGGFPGEVIFSCLKMRLDKGNHELVDRALAKFSKGGK